jgi:hypothetical protein
LKLLLVSTEVIAKHFKARAKAEITRNKLLAIRGLVTEATSK